MMASGPWLEELADNAAHDGNDWARQAAGEKSARDAADAWQAAAAAWQACEAAARAARALYEAHLAGEAVVVETERQMKEKRR